MLAKRQTKPVEWRFSAELCLKLGDWDARLETKPLKVHFLHMNKKNIWFCKSNELEANRFLLVQLAKISFRDGCWLIRHTFYITNSDRRPERTIFLIIVSRMTNEVCQVDVAFSIRSLDFILCGWLYRKNIANKLLNTILSNY